MGEIEDILYELSKIQKNKATEHYIGNLRLRLSKLLRQTQKKSTKKIVYAVKKTGDATVCMVGFPSVGKSSLLNVLTSASSKTAEYEFTTLKPVPGMLIYKDARIQLIDLPGIIPGASKGAGGGRQVLSVARVADLILIITDPEKNGVDTIKKELYEAGIVLDKEKPQIKIKKTFKGGIHISSLFDIDEELIKDILKSYGYANAEVVIKSKITPQDFLDFLRNKAYIPSLVVINKCDLTKKREKGFIYVSAKTGEGIEKLKEEIYKKLQFKVIYLKTGGKVILRGKSTLADLAKKLMLDYKTAKVWGKSVKFPGQVVGLDHVLEDGDIVYFK